ncbi:B12-binding domain-containing radical SAM protein [Granulosicoccus antarcticus]|nr:DUF4080 domain-containing protein [Granulosicoccus antarcticus]
MKDITLATINARYIHASLGLRYLFANMGELQPRTLLQEFTLEQRPEDIVELLLRDEVKIIGFGVYIWNVLETTDVMRFIKILRPDIQLVIGGPEVSYELDEQPICKLADFVITGAADTAFAELCEEILRGDKPSKLVSSLPIQLDSLASPYPWYSDEDVAHRVLYVEASRGCPFKCEFCLSSLDKSAVAFDLPHFLDQMQQLIDRGARQFKFVDRTFNLKAETSRQILEFFLTQMDKGLFLHFELIPDRLPEVLLNILPRFPPNSLQFEIGIQSFNAEVQKRISRRQQHERTCTNLVWLRENTTAHVHADLIFGLPGEDLHSFGEGFDLLYSLGPQEIQVGILKRLRGTPIARHTAEYDMRYQATPPYRILAHKDANFDTIQRMVRFARYWDLIGNSGRFPSTLPTLLGDSPFVRFMGLSDWLFKTTAQTHRIALPKLFELLRTHLLTELQLDMDTVHEQLLSDHKHNRLKGVPAFARQQQPSAAAIDASRQAEAATAQRQRRHL